MRRVSDDLCLFAFSLVCQKLKPQLLERSYQELDANFRSYTRALVGLACNLHRSRELRSLFLELVERCLEPWRQVSWSHTDLRNFLACYFQCALEMDVLRYVVVVLLLHLTVWITCLMRSSFTDSLHWTISFGRVRMQWAPFLPGLLSVTCLWIFRDRLVFAELSFSQSFSLPFSTSQLIKNIALTLSETTGTFDHSNNKKGQTHT